jgi:hypothetical protein
VFLIVGAPVSGRSGFPFITYLVRGGWCIKLTDQLRKPVRNPLSHDVVVHGAELVADSRLNFGIEAALPAGWGVLGLRFCILHDLFHIFPG